METAKITCEHCKQTISVPIDSTKKTETLEEWKENKKIIEGFFYLSVIFVNGKLLPVISFDCPKCNWNNLIHN